MEKDQEDIIDKMLKKQIGYDERFKQIYCMTIKNSCGIMEISLSEEESYWYEQFLDIRTNAGILKKGIGFKDASTAGYMKKLQLMNGKNAHIHIAFYRNRRVDIIVNYEDENINLVRDENESRQIATELLFPELKNILDIKDRGKENRNQR